MNKKIVENIFSLSIINVLNMALPLVTLPYLMKTVGVDKYGAYSIVYSMILYVLLFTEYGFLFTTTKNIAQHKDNIAYVSKIFNSTIICSVLLSIIPYLIFGIITYVVFPFDYLEMFIYGLGIVLGSAFNATWLFQGMEEMRYITIVSFVSKVLFTLLIFVFIHTPEDYKYIILLNSAGFLIAGILAVFLARKEFRLKFLIPNLSDVKAQLIDGFYVFLSTVFMNLYRNSNTFILGLFVSETMVGFYAGAEKIIKACQAVVSPISNALFPHYAEKFKNKSMSESVELLMNFVTKLSMLLIILCVFILICAPLLNYVLLGGSDENANLLIRVMAPVVFFGGLNYVLGIVGLVNLGKNRTFVINVAISGILSIAFLLLTVQYWGNLSAAISMSIAELVLFILCMRKLIEIKKG